MDGFCSLTILPEQGLGRIVPLSAEQETDEAEAAASPAAEDAAGAAEQPPAVSAAAVRVRPSALYGSTMRTFMNLLISASPHWLILQPLSLLSSPNRQVASAVSHPCRWSGPPSRWHQPPPRPRRPHPPPRAARRSRRPSSPGGSRPSPYEGWSGATSRCRTTTDSKWLLINMEPLTLWRCH